jgi:hypothetical protein
VKPVACSTLSNFAAIPASYISSGLPCFPTPPTGAQAIRVNQNFGTWYQIGNGAQSWYHSLQVAVTKRLSRGVQFQGSYTWAHQLDDAAGQGFGEGGGVAPLYPGNRQLIDYGRSPTDIRHNFHFNLLYHIPGIKSENFAAKLTQGWWMGNIISVATGNAVNLTESNARSQSFPLNQGSIERPSFVTSANLAQALVQNPNAVVYNPSTFYIGTTSQWFNPNMLFLQPVGTLGNVPRNFVTAPGTSNWDFSINKDTRVKYLGEAGSLQFRAEIFNILNHPFLGAPSLAVFGGTATDTGAPLGNAGQITSTAPLSTSRQIQLALKLIF